MSDTESRLKCTDETYCTLLDERIHGQEGRRVKGFLVATIFLFSSGDSFLTPVFYGDVGGEPPTYLNFCPFCGHSFASRLARFEEAKAESRRRHEASGERDFIPRTEPKKRKGKTQAA